MTRHWVALEQKNVGAYCPGDQRHETQLWAGPCSLEAPEGCSSPVPASGGTDHLLSSLQGSAVTPTSACVFMWPFLCVSASPSSEDTSHCI
jgi:hypothetical protein